MELIVALIFGLLVGSFLNVAIYRLHPDRRDAMTVIKPARSFCPSCHTQLTALDNIPVLSWLFLAGKCRHCKTQISIIYPIVELMSAASCVGSVIRFGFTPTAFVIYSLIASLIVISFIDLASKIIPNVITYPGIIIGCMLGIAAQFTNLFTFPLTSSAQDSLFGAFAGSGFLYLVSWGYYVVTKRIGLGGGDIKLLAMTGAILGWQSALPTIVLGSLAGAVIGVLVMIFAKGGRHTEIPFGPWLSLGALLYVFQVPGIEFLWPPLR